MSLQFIAQVHNQLKTLDSGFRRNDGKSQFRTFNQLDLKKSFSDTAPHSGHA
jgi:hypothetical protein